MLGWPAEETNTDSGLIDVRGMARRCWGVGGGVVTV